MSPVGADPPPPGVQFWSSTPLFQLGAELRCGVQPVQADVLKGTVKPGSNCMVSLTSMRKQMTQVAWVVPASRMSTEVGMDVAIPEGELAFDPLHRTAG